MAPLLTQKEVVRYLLHQNLIQPKSIHASDLLVIDASRRNYNLKVLTKQGASFLIKQAAELDAVETIANEAEAYRFLNSNPQCKSLHEYLPRYYDYDSERNLLVLELLTGGAQDLEQYYARGYFSTTIAKLKGKALAALHTVMTVEFGGEVFAPRIADHLPWVFSIHRPSLAEMRDMTTATCQAIGIMQRHGEMGELVDSIAQEWRPTALIHGDMKWANLIVFSRSGLGRKTRLKIVDWEYASRGDPCWDVGGVFSGYLSLWVLSMPVVADIAPTQWEKLSRFPLDRMQPAIRSFWQSYARHMNLDRVDRDVWLWRSTMYAAVRLLQTTIERTQTASQLTANITSLLQLAVNILKRPRDAVVHLLGVPLQQ